MKPLSALSLLLVLGFGYSLPILAQSPLDASFQVADRYFAEHGYEGSSDAIYSTLPQTATGMAVLVMQDGVTYGIRTMCDADCRALSYRLVDPDGGVVTSGESLEGGDGELWFRPSTSQTYVLHVTMDSCSAELCYWGVKSYAPTTSEAVSWGTGHDAATDTPARRADTGEGPASGFMGSGGAGRRALDGYFEMYDIDMGRIGFYPYARRVGGRLATGQSARGTVSLEAGHDYIVFASCNIHCTESTARLLDDETELATTSQPGGSWIDFRPERAGEYTVEFVMTNCDEDDCPWGIKAYRAESYAQARANTVDPDDTMMETAVDGNSDGSKAEGVESEYYTPTQVGLGPGAGSIEVSGELSAGDSRTADGTYQDVYSFNTRAGQTLAIEVSARGFEPVMFVYPPDGYSIDTYDRPSRGERSELEVEISDAGEWHVAVTSRSSDDGMSTGRYTLRLRLTGDPSGKRSKR